ncbi:unnamed protein product [Prorocentrum cordatum]|uniref:Uncharacterized protein n=1 Tax=Prorocentrum cordatum TaxID=2364126 RepID=A0ABN9VGP0_9DINO|nr:unnamed protein product [Polarella glacialis]
MGVGHSMNQSQVESVLSNFEDTMKAIKGIEQKADRVNEMLSETQRQQDALHGQMDRGQEFVKSVTDSLNLSSSQVLHFRDSGIVEVVEKLEDTLYDLGLRDLPGKMQREFGPIFVPVLVLTLIVTVSNCAFGFLLATDAELSLQGGTMNMVNMFATIHVVLIGLAVLHLVVEIVLRVVKTARRRRAARSREEQLQAVGDDRAEHSAEDRRGVSAAAAAGELRPWRRHGDAEREEHRRAREGGHRGADQGRGQDVVQPQQSFAVAGLDCRKSHKSVASRDTEGSFTQGSPKRTPGHQPGGPERRPGREEQPREPRGPAAQPREAQGGDLRHAAGRAADGVRVDDQLRRPELPHAVREQWAAGGPHRERVPRHQEGHGEGVGEGQGRLLARRSDADAKRRSQ